jgi:hypothetical protein
MCFLREGQPNRFCAARHQFPTNGISEHGPTGDC